MDDSNDSIEGVDEEQDRGTSLEFAIGLLDNKIIIDFGQPIWWFTMNEEEVQRLIDLLNEKLLCLKMESPGSQTIQ